LARRSLRQIVVPRRSEMTVVSDDGEGSGAAVDRLRVICAGQPGTTERLSHGEPTWFVRDRTFVTLADHHHDDRFGFWCAAPPGAQETLVASDPERFFRPPYVGVRGWLGVYLDVPVDWEEVARLVRDAHRYVVETRRRR
jgi:predicted DNA-binding protein (MmcQ/YjbR family)